jgi:hypothetical protein
MYWKNSNFQNAFFIAGKSHTPDEAWLALKRQWNDRDLALRVADATLMKQQAHVNTLKNKLWWAELFRLGNIALRLRGELMEIAAHYGETKNCYEGALQERASLQKMMDTLEPHRKYGHLTDNDAAQASQKEYWLHELVTRAENYLITTGSIPTDHFATMRSHPDYKGIIAPEIEKLYVQHRSGQLTLGTAKNLNDSLLLEVARDMPALLPAPPEV